METWIQENLKSSQVIQGHGGLVLFIGDTYVREKEIFDTLFCERYEL